MEVLNLICRHFFILSHFISGIFSLILVLKITTNSIDCNFLVTDFISRIFSLIFKRTSENANSGKLEQTQANSGKLRQTQANSGKLRQTQTNSGKLKLQSAQ